MDNTSLIKDHFLSFWHHFLFFEIMRSKKAVDMIGNANGYLVFQIIAWHHILILTSSSSSILRDEAVKLWNRLSKSGSSQEIYLSEFALNENFVSEHKMCEQSNNSVSRLFTRIISKGYQTGKSNEK